MRIATIVIMFFAANCSASIYQVGSSKTYISPNALYQAGVVESGDTIEVDAEIYSGTACLAVWQEHDLLIRGVGGRPSLEANGEYIWGKGIWVLGGNNITVENIEFSGAAVPDLNGAGIRLDGIGLTVRHCYFHDNENGILTNNSYDGDILIEYSEFENNGAGDGFSHNLYIGHVNRLTFRFNYSHHAYIGHNLKSRANENYILYNRIMDEESGQSSRLIDLSNGGFSIVMGNLLMQGNHAENNNLLGFGLEGLTNEKNELYFTSNTAVNKRQASCIFLDIEEGTFEAQVVNNIFAGAGTLINGTGTVISNNIADDNIDNLLFTDEQNYDYNLQTTSSAVNAGTLLLPVNGLSIVPAYEYVHPMDFKVRNIVLSLDAGAIEGDVLHSVEKGSGEDRLEVFPNPFVDRIIINDLGIDKADISIFSLSGEILNSEISIYSTQANTVLDASNLARGMYILRVKSRNKIIYRM